MASRRKLKKQVVQLVGQIYEDAVLLQQLSTQTVQEQLDELIDDLIVFTDDTIRRIQHPDGKDTPKLIRSYYRKLRNDIAEREADFNDRIEALLTAE